MNRRLETGQQFFRSFGSRLFCFRRGQTIAVLNAVGKEPVRKDVLIMSMIAGSRYERQSEKRDAGIGSSSHDLKDIDFSVWYFHFRDRMKARERCSGEWWVRRAQLERCLVKLVTNILNFSTEERREHGWQFSCTVRGRQSRGFSNGQCKEVHSWWSGVLWLKKSHWCGCYSAWFWWRK